MSPSLDCKCRGAQLKGAGGQEKLHAVAIYANMSAELQAQVFLPAPPGTRKVLHRSIEAEGLLLDQLFEEARL